MEAADCYYGSSSDEFDTVIVKADECFSKGRCINEKLLIWRAKVLAFIRVNCSQNTDSICTEHDKRSCSEPDINLSDELAFVQWSEVIDERLLPINRFDKIWVAWDCSGSAHVVKRTCYHSLRNMDWYHLSPWKGRSIFGKETLQSMCWATITQEKLKCNNGLERKVTGCYTCSTQTELPTCSLHDSIYEINASLDKSIFSHRWQSIFVVGPCVYRDIGDKRRKYFLTETIK